MAKTPASSKTPSKSTPNTENTPKKQPVSELSSRFSIAAAFIVALLAFLSTLFVVNFVESALLAEASPKSLRKHDLAVIASMGLWNRTKSDPVESRGNGQLQLIYQSPIFRINVQEMGVNSRVLNERLGRAIRESHDSLSRERVARDLKELDDEEGMGGGSEKGGEASGWSLDVWEMQARKRMNMSAVEAYPWLGEETMDEEDEETEEVVHNIGDTSKFNDAFFLWQTALGGWDIMFSDVAEFSALKKLWQRAADHFLTTLGGKPVFAGVSKQDLPEMQAWATLHRDCVFHGAHSHGEEILSGVYYVKMPPGASGRISFHDPRGPHPPFDQKISILPREGDIVFFPTYLIHQVTPTPGNAERISIAVNIGASETAKKNSPDAGNPINVPQQFLQSPIDIHLKPIVL